MGTVSYTHLLLNAREKLEVEKMAGYYDEEKDLAPLEIYQYYMREVKRGVDTYWLSKPLHTGVSQRHTVTLEGGDPVSYTHLIRLCSIELFLQVNEHHL